MSKSHKVKTSKRSTLHETLKGRKSGAHTPKHEKRAKDKLRKELGEY